MKKIIYRSVIQIEVLSPEPIPDSWCDNCDLIEDIIDEYINGQYSGVREFKIKNKPVKGKKAVTLILNQGSYPGFFFMDDKGNEVEE